MTSSTSTSSRSLGRRSPLADPNLRLIPPPVLEIIFVAALDDSPDLISKVYKEGGLDMVRIFHTYATIKPMPAYMLLLEACAQGDTRGVRWLLDNVPLPHIEHLLRSLWFVACLAGDIALADVFENDSRLFEGVAPEHMTIDELAQLGAAGHVNTLEKALGWLGELIPIQLTRLWEGAWRSGKYEMVVRAYRMLKEAGIPATKTKPKVDVVAFNNDPRLVHFYYRCWPQKTHIPSLMQRVCDQGQIQAVAQIRKLWSLELPKTQILRLLDEFTYKGNVDGLSWLARETDFKEIQRSQGWATRLHKLWANATNSGNPEAVWWYRDNLGCPPEVMALLPPSAFRQTVVFDAVVDKYPGCEPNTGSMTAGFQRECKNGEVKLLKWYYDYFAKKGASALSSANRVMRQELYDNAGHRLLNMYVLGASMADRVTFMMSKVWDPQRWDVNCDYLRCAVESPSIELFQLIASRAKIIPMAPKLVIGTSSKRGVSKKQEESKEESKEVKVSIEDSVPMIDDSIPFFLRRRAPSKKKNTEQTLSEAKSAQEMTHVMLVDDDKQYVIGLAVGVCCRDQSCEKCVLFGVTNINAFCNSTSVHTGPLTFRMLHDQWPHMYRYGRFRSEIEQILFKHGSS
jgi:hypothetical protein